MNSFNNFFQSSIGKKILMATTGILLCFFLATHLIGNFMLFAGADTFNSYVLKLSMMKPIVRCAEVILTIIFLIHIINGFRLTRENKSAKPNKYESSTNETSSFFSRNMGLSGSIVLIFLIVHLSTFWRIFQKTHGNDIDYYSIVTASSIGFSNPIITIIYILGIALLGFHLKHGFQSAFKTFGIINQKYKFIVDMIALLFWFIIPASFISIAIFFGIIKCL